MSESSNDRKEGGRPEGRGMLNKGCRTSWQGAGRGIDQRQRQGRWGEEQAAMMDTGQRCGGGGGTLGQTKGSNGRPQTR